MSVKKMANNVFCVDEDEFEEYNSDLENESDMEYGEFHVLSNEELDMMMENRPGKYIEDKVYIYRSPTPVNIPSSFIEELKMVSLKPKIIKKIEKNIMKKAVPMTWASNHRNKNIPDVLINERDFPTLSKDFKEVPQEDDNWVEIGKKKKKSDIAVYAHAVEEIIIKKCFFDSRCNHVVKDKFGTYKNISKDKVCSFIHSNESMGNYKSRTCKKVSVPMKLIELKTLIAFVNPISNENRNKAFEILKDKEKIKDTLKCTKMCSSTLNNVKCPHKGNCRFAHDVKELNVRYCLFMDNCKFVKKNEKGEFSNINNEKICYCKHKDESMDNYYKRIGIESKETMSKIYIKAPKIFSDMIKSMGKRNSLNIILEAY